MVETVLSLSLWRSKKGVGSITSLKLMAVSSAVSHLHRAIFPIAPNTPHLLPPPRGMQRRRPPQKTHALFLCEKIFRLKYKDEAYMYSYSPACVYIARSPLIANKGQGPTLTPILLSSVIPLSLSLLSLALLPFFLYTPTNAIYQVFSWLKDHQ